MAEEEPQRVTIVKEEVKPPQHILNRINRYYEMKARLTGEIDESMNEDLRRQLEQTLRHWKLNDDTCSAGT